MSEYIIEVETTVKIRKTIEIDALNECDAEHRVGQLARCYPEELTDLWDMPIDDYDILSIGKVTDEYLGNGIKF